jgi:BirA family biotin operon repressor/biotin-[acetyl-CoA-carboxylase] ligase
MLHAAAAGDEKGFDLERIDLFTETESTNRFLIHNPPSRPNALRLCFAEWQSSGRGRQDRQWRSPLGSGICMSAAWIYEGTPTNFAAMGLAAGAAIAECIKAQCGIDVQLKWPNDLVWEGRKLGGILVESRIEAHGLCHVVVGAGINVAVPEDVLAKLSDWQTGAVDIRTALQTQSCGRNELAAGLAVSLGSLLSAFERTDAAPWLQSWRRLDYLHGKPVRIGTTGSVFDGVADGIDDDGALLVLNDAGQRRRVMAGDASVRPQ